MPPPGNLPNLGTELRSHTLHVDSSLSEPSGKKLSKNFTFILPEIFSTSTIFGPWWKCKLVYSSILPCMLTISLSVLLVSHWISPNYTLKPLFSSVQLLTHVLLFATPWTTACQTSLSITNSQSLLKLMSIESVMSSNHLILCHPLYLLPSIFPSIRVFSDESVLRIRWPK